MGQHFEDVSFAVNYYEGMNALGGKLHIGDNVAVFRPHQLNFGTLQDRIIPICDITGYKKGSLSTLYIYLQTGKEIKLACWKKNAIINAIEERRQIICKQQAPQPFSQSGKRHHKANTDTVIDSKRIMAKNDFSSEVAENYEQKCLCVLVLDVSGSMSGSPIRDLNNGLQDFYDEISNDPTTSQRLEVAIVTFSDVVSTIQPPALVENFAMPRLSTGGMTATVSAVREAINLVAARKAWYKTTGQRYYRPWIILMTDGEPDNDQDVEGLAQQIKMDTADSVKKYTFLPIGVGEYANMGILAKIQGTIPPMKLKGTKFSSFFQWLSASMGTVVSANEGQQVDLSAGADNWMETFKI